MLRAIVSKRWTQEKIATTVYDRMLQHILKAIHLLGGKLSKVEEELLLIDSYIEEPD